MKIKTKPVQFCLSDNQINFLDKYVAKEEIKNRSEWLRRVIDKLRKKSGHG